MNFSSLVLTFVFILRLFTKKNINVREYIRRCYGEDRLRTFQSYLNTSIKHQKASLDVLFLTKCKTYNVFPKFLRFKLYKKILLSSAFYKAWQNKLLVNELNSKKRAVIALSDKLKSHTEIIDQSFPALTRALIHRYVSQRTEESRTATSLTHTKKLENLGVRNDLEPCNPDAVIFNFSSVTLSPRLKYLLAFGLDFCLPVYSINFNQYFLSFEKLIQALKNCSQSVTPEVNSRIKAIAYKCYYNFKPYKIFSAIFSKSDVASLQSLAKNDTIIVTRPDKGRGVVIVDKDVYIKQMNSIISDSSKFSKITDPIDKFTRKIEDKINNYLRKLKNLQLISDDIYKQLSVTGSGPGILYGLPKIHKPNFHIDFPFRPIFAAYNNPSFKLAKFLVPILAPFTTNQYTVDNSQSFSSQITDFKNADEFYMVSFDVDSLFTNIPLKETIDICLNLLFENNTHVIGLTRSHFKTLLELSVLNSFFMFNNAFYKQIEGLGMGLPLGPTFANIFMCFYEKRWLSDCPYDFRPVFYRRYVDDTFILFRHSSHASLFLDYLNSKHPNINFIMGKEKENKLSFLDTTVSRSNNIFCTSVYRKSTFTGLGISFFSHCTFRFKINSIKTLLHRAFNVCSSYTALHAEFSFLKIFFRNNGFPQFLIESSIKKFLSSKFENSQSVITVPKRNLFISFPYFGSQSDKLIQELSSTLCKYFPSIDFHFILVNNFKIGSFFKYKDTLPGCLRSSVVYQFSCGQCSSGYVGCTSRTLQTRIAEHLGRSVRTGLPLASPPHSSIREHAERCDHTVSPDHFKILGSANSVLDLRILESIFISQIRPNLNDMQSSFPLKILSH